MKSYIKARQQTHSLWVVSLCLFKPFLRICAWTCLQRAKKTSAPQATPDDIVSVPKPIAKNTSKPQAPKDDNMHEPQPPAQSTSGSQAPLVDTVSVPQTPAERTYVTKAPVTQDDGRENSSAPKTSQVLH